MGVALQTSAYFSGAPNYKKTLWASLCDKSIFLLIACGCIQDKHPLYHIGQSVSDMPYQNNISRLYTIYTFVWPLGRLKLVYPFTKKLHVRFVLYLWTVWPDWAIFCTLGYFLTPLATINLPKSTTFLAIFCKGVKIYNFSFEIIFGQLLWTFFNFFLVTLQL